MARTAAAVSLDSIIESAVQPVVEKTASAIAKAVAAMVAERLEAELRMGAGKRGAKPGRTSARAKAGDITKWVADRRARRVPTFVIESTGLDTKKKIVAKFGENSTFEKGKPLPKAR